ncbi:MAG: 4Fe-4S dicluster domain-containing protein [Deltaproteobacteria bacterium]|nr:4Fe-4S dicluster domain-containing protein [Deltaproteobacteria bacterium]
MDEVPAQYAPDVSPNEFLATDRLPEGQQVCVGVLFVGAGPAGLAGAIRLAQLLNGAPAIKERLGEFPVAVIEKGKYPGAHLLSGAVVNPGPFHTLFPQLTAADFPFAQSVPAERVYFLTPRRAWRMPVPPTMRNHGNMIASLSRVGAWLGQQAEAAGVMILNETTGVKMLVQDGVVSGVRTGDKGRGKDGAPLANFEPGVDLVAHWTVMSDGGTSPLTSAMLHHFGVARRHPQIYALGVKEVWEVPTALDAILHTMGWPLRTGRAFREFGGSFAYPVGPNRVALGMVVGLDYADASLSVHHLLQALKEHPLFRRVLAGGKHVDQWWGAKTIPEGGYAALPTQFHLPGACVVGDAAGFVNVPALKGIHYAMRSGIYAAEAIFAALAAQQPERTLVGYDVAIRNSFIMQELYAVRNVRQAYHYGFWMGSLLAGCMLLTGGRFPGGIWGLEADAMHPVSDGGREWPRADGHLTFDKLTGVHASGNRSRDHQPNHLRVTTAVPDVIGKTWIRMCPAEVYEWGPGGVGARRLVMNPTNCVQCGAISAKGGLLTPPEGGSGPEYTEM